MYKALLLLRYMHTSIHTAYINEYCVLFVQVSSMLVAIFSRDIGGFDYWKVLRLIFLTTLALVPTPLESVELELKKITTESSPFQLAIVFRALIDSLTISMSKTLTAEMELVALLELRMAIYTM